MPGSRFARAIVASGFAVGLLLAGCGDKSPFSVQEGAAPALGTVSPARGPAAGGTVAVLRGLNFRDGTKVSFGGALAPEVRWVDAQTLTVVTPEGQAGAVDIAIHAPDEQTATFKGGFTYYTPDSTTAPAPGLAAITPNTGPASGGTYALVTGTTFQDGALLFVGRAPATEVVVVDGQVLSARLPAGAVGAQDVELTNPDGQSARLPEAFAYYAGDDAGPVLSAVSPVAGGIQGGTPLALAGTGFKPGALVLVGGRPAADVTVTQTVANATAPAGAPGVVDVALTNPDGRSTVLRGGYNYYSGGPTLLAVSPPFGAEAGGTQIVITGRNFGNQVIASLGNKPVGALQRVDDRTLLGVTPSGTTGPVDLYVLNADGQSDRLAAAFNYGVGPAAELAIVRVTPLSGPATGGTKLTVIGSGFGDGVAVSIGGQPATQVVVLGQSALTVVSPPGSIGRADVQVTLGSQTVTLPGGYSYFDPSSSAPAPVVSSVQPSVGPSTGGTRVKVTGGDFAQGARVFFGANEGADVVWIQPSLLTVLTPASGIGAVDVRVQNPDGRADDLAGAFVFVDPGTLGPAPVLTQVAPSSGGTIDPIAVAITAQNVTAGADVYVRGVPASGVQLSPGAVAATFPPLSAGAADVSITNPDGQTGTLANGFTYDESSPVVQSATPDTVPLAGGIRVLVFGQGFLQGAQISLDGAPLLTTFHDPTLVSAELPPRAEGTVALTVTNPSGKSGTLPGGITYADIQLGQAPSLASILPAQGPATGGTVALVVGQGFVTGAKVLFGSGQATGVTVMSGTHLSAVAPAGPVGPADITVINPDGQSAQLLQAFLRVDPASYTGPGPSLVGVTPNKGVATGGTQTVLTGGGFQSGMLVFYGGVSATASSVANANIASATTPPGQKGPVAVALTNLDGRSFILNGAFTYVAPPQPTSVTDAFGPVSGGKAFLLSGDDFAPGAKVFFGAVEAPLVTVQPPFLIDGTTPSHAAGTVDVKVVNPDGQAGTLPAAYTFFSPPQVSTLSPGAGPTAGGFWVQLTGAGFRAGATVTFGGQASPEVQLLSASELWAQVPPGPVGPADVVVQNADGQAFTLVKGLVWETAGYDAKRAVTYPGQILSAARDDAAYRSDVGVLNLSSAPVTVTLSSVDAAGAQIAARTLSDPLPPFGRAHIADALQFIETASAQTGRTASVVVQADGPVSSWVALTDRTSNDVSLLHGADAQRAASRLHLPYASSVGAFKTWLWVRNAGQAAAQVNIVARDGAGAQLAVLNAVPIPAGGLYSHEDILGAMGLPGATATLEIDAPGALLLAHARTWSSARLGGLLPGIPTAQASVRQVLAYVPDTNLETSVLYLHNTEATGAASATLSLREPGGQVLGTQVVTIPARGYVAVPDLARTVLSKTVPTQTVSSVVVNADRKLVAMAQVLSTATSDLRFYPARPAGGARLLVPAVDTRTALAVTNNGAATANVEVALRTDAGTERGLRLLLSLPPGGSFNAPALLGSLGATDATGWVEVVSRNGQPLSAVARVGNLAASAGTGDGLSLAAVFTTPSLDSVTPAQGPEPGGTMARLQGAFLQPRATFFFGSATATRSQVSSNQLAVAVSPAGTAGPPVALAVVNPDGARALLPAAFTYLAPAILGTPPTVASASPNQVSTLGGTLVQVNGASFDTGAQVFFGLSPGTGTAQVNPNRLDSAAPAGPMGPADVTVTNPDGQSATLAGAVQYVVPPPAVTSVVPSTGPGAGGTAVELTGTAFQQGATVLFGAKPATQVAVQSSTRITLVTPSGTDGPVAVTVQNPDGQIATVNNGFVYVAAPQVLQVVPSSGPTSGGTSIQITGSFFQTGATVAVGSAAAAAVVVAAGGTQITCQAPAGSAGPAAITVTNPDGQSGVLNNAFTYLAPIPAPTVNAVSPNYGPTTGGTQVSIQGAAFQAGAQVFFGANPAVSSNTLSPSAIVAVSPGAAGPGQVSVRVVNPDGQDGTLPLGFSYYQPADLPAVAIVSLMPNEGPPTGGNAVFVSGQGFKAGATVTFGVIPSPQVDYLGPSALSVIAPAHPLGQVNVTVTNPGGDSATLAGGYNFTQNAIFAPPAMRLPMEVQPGNTNLSLFDADNDGDLDLFVGRYSVGCQNDGNDQLWINDGTGTYTEQPSFPGDAARRTVAAVTADFLGNGTQDVFAITDQLTVPASLWRNNPLGVFTRVDVANIGGTTAANTIRSLVVGDFDTDGLPDVLAVNNGRQHWFRNNGGGSFTATFSGIPNLADNSTAACVADFDSDGDDDIFVVNSSNQQANYYLQGPAGTFTLSNTLIPVVGGNGTACVAGEFRPGSGVKDVIVFKDGQAGQYLRNNGLGVFTDEASSLNIFRLPPQPNLRVGNLYWDGTFLLGGVEAVDIDLDGDLDLLVRHHGANPRLQIYLNDGAAFFQIGTAGRMETSIDEVWSFAVGDVNSDSRADAILLGNNVQHRMLLNGPGGVLRHATMKTLPEQSYCTNDAVKADIDGDGDEDLIIAPGCPTPCTTANCEAASCRDDGIRVWLSDGAGGFVDATATRFPAFPWNATAIAAADLDGDGDVDLVVGTSGWNADGSVRNMQGLRLYLNDGTGVFTDETYPRVPEEVYWTTSIALLDVEKDGHPDIYLTWATNSTCSSGHRLYRNTGPAFFIDVTTSTQGGNQLPAWPNTPCGARPRQTVVGDFNGDTYPDLYVTTATQNIMYFNQGPTSPGFFGNVTNSHIPNVNDDSYGAAVGDINGDAFPDLFVCNGASNRSQLNFGSATGVLSDNTLGNWPSESQTHLTCTNNPIDSRSCTLGDVDGDGDLDVLLAGGTSSFKHRLRYFMNIGGGLFSDRTGPSLPFDSDNNSKVLFLRANADTRPDIFVGQCGGQPRVYVQQ